jgi:hypothetical protein
MVDGCSYARTVDLHRLVPGRDGGEYVVGNMVAICPNHHAEVHRRLVVLRQSSSITVVAEDRPPLKDSAP